MRMARPWCACGIPATLMDELGGWIVNRKLQTAGMTTALNMKYRNPVPTGEGVILEIRGRITEMKRNFAFIHATLSHNGTVCSSCDMTYFCFPKDKAEKNSFLPAANWKTDRMALRRYNSCLRF